MRTPPSAGIPNIRIACASHAIGARLLANFDHIGELLMLRERTLKLTPEALIDHLAGRVEAEGATEAEDAEEDERIRPETAHPQIIVRTMHSAKGLEFHTVFICGLEEGLFPHENSLTEADGLDEERRLMYVAITRARQRLYLSFSQTRMLHGQTRYNVRSRFFDELPDGALKWLTPRNAGFGSGFARDYQAAWARGSGLHSIVGAGRVGSASQAPASSSRPGPASCATSAGGRWRSGQSVFHNKFGEGVIITLEGSGEDARAQVNFGRHGVKWLALAIAKLTPVD
jgi:DNA helicase-2/ATP-dependent DNA helicase PcrA